MKRFTLITLSLLCCAGIFFSYAKKFKEENMRRIQELNEEISDIRRDNPSMNVPALRVEVRKLTREKRQADSLYNYAPDNTELIRLSRLSDTLQHSIDSLNEIINNTPVQSNSPELDALIYERDSLLLDTYINGIIFDPCPVDQDINYAVAQLNTIEHPDWKWIADDYLPMIENYPRYTAELLKVMENPAVFEPKDGKEPKIWRRGLAESNNSFLETLQRTTYYKQYLTTKDDDEDNDASIPYLDGVVDKIMDFDNNVKHFQESKVEAYKQQRDELIAMLTRENVNEVDKVEISGNANPVTANKIDVQRADVGTGVGIGKKKNDNKGAQPGSRIVTTPSGNHPSAVNPVELFKNRIKAELSKNRDFAEVTAAYKKLYGDIEASKQLKTKEKMDLQEDATKAFVNVLLKAGKDLEADEDNAELAQQIVDAIDWMNENAQDSMETLKESQSAEIKKLRRYANKLVPSDD